MKKFNKKFMSPFLLILLLQGCMPDSLTKFSKTEAKKTAAPSAVIAPPTATTPSSATSVTPPDLTTLQVFQLKNITQNSTSYHLHKYGEGNSLAECNIPIASLGSGDTVLVDQTSDILCWLEGDEQQLYFNGADFQVNAPVGTCDYIEVKPYYYWNAQPKLTNYSITSDSPPPCEADYTLDGGPNCDEGTMTVTGTANGSAPTVVQCGGKRSACLGGPGVDYKTNDQGYPVPVDTLAYTGLSINYSVKAPGPLGKGFGSNRYISNFTSYFVTGLYTYDYTTIGSSTGMEIFSIDSTDSSTALATLIAQDPLKDSVFRVQPFYEFSCLNYAHEVKGRIRVQIREWNKIFTIPIGSNTEVSEAAPLNLMKHSTSATDHETSGVGYWNDIMSWDFMNQYGKNELDTSVHAGFVVPASTSAYGFRFPKEGFTK